MKIVGKLECGVLCRGARPRKKKTLFLGDMPNPRFMMLFHCSLTVLLVGPVAGWPSEQHQKTLVSKFHPTGANDTSKYHPTSPWLLASFSSHVDPTPPPSFKICRAHAAVRTPASPSTRVYQFIRARDHHLQPFTVYPGTSPLWNVYVFSSNLSPSFHQTCL